MKIKDVCAQTGLTDRTIRYYIECGLVCPHNKEQYSGRRSFSFSRDDVEQLEKIKILRASGFSIDQIKTLQHSHTSRDIIRARLDSLEVEQRTGQHLYAALQKADITRGVSMDELVIILSSPETTEPMPTIEETAPLHQLLRRATTTIRTLSTMLTVVLLCSCVLFVLMGGPHWLQNRSLNGVALLGVRENGVFLPCAAYTIGGACNIKDGENGYTFESPYGDLRFNVLLEDDLVIEGGLFNTNNWHHLSILLDVERTDSAVTVTQIVTYKTDGDRVETLSLSKTIASTENVIDVYMGLAT